MQHYQRRMTTSVRGNSLRSEIPLTREQIMAVAPSVYAEEKHESRSQRYTCIPTGRILEGLQNEGFQPFFCTQTKSKEDGKMGFAKHMLRLRHVGSIQAASSEEIIIINSADGSSGAQILAGIFEAACANGCVIGSVVNDIRVRHTGNIVDDVIEGSYRILKDFEIVRESMDDMKSITLSRPEQEAFGRSALSLRWDEDAPITAEQVTQPRRREDIGNSLWTTMQVIQENLIRGGVIGKTKEGKRTRTRAVNAIAENTKLNQAIWSLGEAMRGLKA